MKKIDNICNFSLENNPDVVDDPDVEGPRRIPSSEGRLQYVTLFVKVNLRVVGQVVSKLLVP